VRRAEPKLKRLGRNGLNIQQSTLSLPASTQRKQEWRVAKAGIRNFSPSENRLKNRFNSVVSNGDFLQVFDFNGAPEEIRTPDP